MKIKCLCGKEVFLQVYGGQYQNEYRGDCECSRKWVLTEISELMAEIEESQMYVKHAHNPSLTLKLKEHILTMLSQIKPVNSFPPSLQFFKPEHVEPFKELDKVGEFTVEFLLVATELMAIQEKTNYPRGSLTESMYKDFGVKDRFSVIQKAVLKRLR